MADEPEQTTKEPTLVAPAPPVTEEPKLEVRPETETEPSHKHPLEEGGVRFNEVYGRMKAAEAQATLLREQLAQRTAEPATPAAPAAPTYTHEQLQAAADQGRITTAQMAAQLAWQAKEEAKREIRVEWGAQTRRQDALGEVNAYIKRMPALAVSSSPEFQQVARVAYEIADEMGVDVRDPRVQRRALRETFGHLDKLAKTHDDREYNRRHAAITTETGGGGGRDTSSTKDPLKDIPRELTQHWDRLGYTKAQRLAELPHVNWRRWGR